MKPSISSLYNNRPLTPNQIDFYKAHGYLVLDSVLTEEGLETFRSECMAAWEAEKETFDPEKNWLHNSLLCDIHHRAQVVQEYYFAGPIVDVAEELIGPNIKGVTSQLTFKMRGNTMPFGWHQDNGYGELEPYNTISTLTAFDDTDQENGCLWLIPGSHLEGQIGVKRTAEERATQKEVIVEADESKAIPMPLRAGSVLVMHCWMLHKSDGNLSTNRDRRILFLRYADADAVEVYNDHNPRLGRLLRGNTKFPEVRKYEADLKGPS